MDVVYLSGNVHFLLTCAAVEFYFLKELMVVLDVFHCESIRPNNTESQDRVTSDLFLKWIHCGSSGYRLQANCSVYIHYNENIPEKMLGFRIVHIALCCSVIGAIFHSGFEPHSCASSSSYRDLSDSDYLADNLLLFCCFSFNDNKDVISSDLKYAELMCTTTNIQRY